MVEIPSHRHGRVSSHDPASVARRMCSRVATAPRCPATQAGENKVSVTSITDRFFVPANFEDLGWPPRRTL
jgi:hypothetical protein